LTCQRVSRIQASSGQHLHPKYRERYFVQIHEGYKQYDKHNEVVIASIRRNVTTTTIIKKKHRIRAGDRQLNPRDKWYSLFNKETSGESSSVISDYCCCVISRSRATKGEEIFRSYYTSRLLEPGVSLFIRRIGPEDGNGPRSLQRGWSCGAVSYFKSGRTILKVRQLRSRQREKARTETIFHTPSVGTAPSSRQSARSYSPGSFLSSYFPFPQSALRVASSRPPSLPVRGCSYEIMCTSRKIRKSTTFPFVP